MSLFSGDIALQILPTLSYISWEQMFWGEVKSNEFTLVNSYFWMKSADAQWWKETKWLMRIYVKKSEEKNAGEVIYKGKAETNE